MSEGVWEGEGEREEGACLGEGGWPGCSLSMAPLSPMGSSAIQSHSRWASQKRLFSSQEE